MCFYPRARVLIFIISPGAAKLWQYQMVSTVAWAVIVVEETTVFGVTM